MTDDEQVAAFASACEDYTEVRPTCPRGSPACAGLRPHERVERLVVLVIRDTAHRVRITLMRWWCSCSHTFRSYPPGVLPHKRYLLIEIVSRVRSMLGPVGKSCLQAALVEHAVVVADTIEAPVLPSADAQVVAREEEVTESAERKPRFMAPSTPWRWVGGLSSLHGKLMPEWSRWLSRQSEFSPESWPIPRCRSEGRRGVWSRCLAVLRTLSGNTTDFATSPPGS